MRGDEDLELSDELRVTAELELALEELGLGRHVQLGQPPDLVSRLTLEHDVGQRRPAPETERLPT